MCDERLWQSVWPQLKTQYQKPLQLVHLSIPTTGTMDEVVAAMATKITADEVILVGFSLGGYLASAIALLIPDRIEHLVVIANMLKNLPDAEIKQRKRIILSLANARYSGIANKRIDNLLHPEIRTFQNHTYVEQIKATIAQMDADLGGDVLLHQLKVSISRPLLLQPLATSNIPTTFLVGDADTFVELPALVQEIQETDSAENISVIKIVNTGHMLPLESPQVLTSALINILQHSSE